ncbi:MAG: family 2 glycosyl transferase [Candidatus Frackibacter sp. T328-2]|nr:MAG: family 2 glycosyl transferase [Candidatus Frackibacter sp. T328-2]
MKVRFCFVNSLSGEDEYIVKNLIADLKEALNIDIKKIEDQSSKQQLPKIDLVITDDYQTANLVANEEGKVIYWFRNPSDNFNISNQKLKFPVVVSSRSLGNHLPKELRGEAKIIYPGVMQKVYKPVAVDDMIETTKRRILILGQELNSKKIEHLVKSLELINQGCQMKISIIRKEGFKIETNIEYEFINPNSLEAKVVEYSKAELAIVVAENEGFRLRPLEIMACKTPIIFIHNKGAKEYISHNHNCRLLLYPEPKRLAITALKLLKNNILAKNSKSLSKFFLRKTKILISQQISLPSRSEPYVLQSAEKIVFSGLICCLQSLSFS